MAGSRRTDKQRERCTFSLDPEVVYQAKVQAAKDRQSISEFVEEAIQEKLDDRASETDAKP